MIAYFLGGCAIYGIVLFVLVMLRPKSALHTKKLTDCGRREKITIGVVLVILILLCTLPMGLAPGWNGEDPGATNQYELVAEAILNGELNTDLLISHVFPVERFQEGFDAIKEKRALKVALLFGGDR